MTNAGFGWLNYVITGSITATAAEPALPIQNIQGQQGSPSSGWQTPYGVTAASIMLDCGSDVAMSAFALFRTNLSAAATVRWRVWTAASGGVGTAGYDMGVLPAGVVPGFGQTVSVSPAIGTGRYVQVDISDPTNPDGFINVPLAFVGPLWTPAVNIDYSSTIGRSSSAPAIQSRGGQQIVTFYYQQRVWTVTFQGIRASEVWTQAMPMDSASRTGANLLIVPDQQSALINQESVFGIFAATSALTFALTAANARGWAGTFTERL